MKTNQICGYIENYKKEGTPFEEYAHELVRQSKINNSGDNITVFVLELNKLK